MDYECSQLALNSPYKDFVEINLDIGPQTPDKDWAEALSRNEYVDTIRIVLPRFDAIPNNTALLEVIASRTILEKIILYQHFSNESNQQQKSAQLLAPFLQSIQLNSTVNTVVVNLVYFTAGTIAHFLNNGPISLRRFELYGHYAKVTKEGVNDLTASIQQNQIIKTLVLGKLRDGYMCPILNSLALNRTVENLILRSPTLRAPKTAQAIKLLLQLTTTITSFTLVNLRDAHEHFIPIAKGLLKSESITTLVFDHCHFFRESSVHFLNLLQSKTNLHSLSVYSGSIDTTFFSADNFIHHLGPHSLLESLELRNVPIYNFGFSSLLSFNRLLEATKKSPKLKTFEIGYIYQQDMYEALLSSIPKLQVQTLLFSLESEVNISSVTFLASMNSNPTILCLGWIYNIHRRHPYNNNTVLTNNQQLKLKYYLARNQELYQWKTSYSDTYSSLAKEIWPKLLTTIQPTGPTTMYTVICMLGNAIGPSPVNLLN